MYNVIKLSKPLKDLIKIINYGKTMLITNKGYIQINQLKYRNSIKLSMKKNLIFSWKYIESDLFTSSKLLELFTTL